MANKCCRCFPVHCAFYAALKSRANICMFCRRVAFRMHCCVPARLVVSNIYINIHSVLSIFLSQKRNWGCENCACTPVARWLRWNSAPICSRSPLICVKCGRCRWRLTISSRFYRTARPTLYTIALLQSPHSHLSLERGTSFAQYLVHALSHSKPVSVSDRSRCSFYS